MAHGIEFDNTRQIDPMAFTGEVPWHGLGQQLTPDSPIETWAKEAGMDWDIKSTPALGFNEDSGDVFSFPSRNILYRSDNQTPLSIVSDNYKIVQPMQVLEFYRDLIKDSGFRLNTAGVLFGGKKFWALAEMGQSVKIFGEDKVDGYLLLATSCDGSLATTAQFTSVRVVCNNTLDFSINREQDRAGTIKVTHGAHFDPETVKEQLGIGQEAFQEFGNTINTLANRKVTDREAIDWIVKVVNNLQDDEIVDETSIEQGGEASAKNVQTVYELFKGTGKGSSLSSADGTAWGLVNAVTEHCDHHRKTRTTDNRLNSAWFGAGKNLKNRALTEAIKIAA